MTAIGTGTHDSAPVAQPSTCGVRTILERIGDNTVDVAEQTVFVVTGLYRQFSEPSDEDL